MPSVKFSSTKVTVWLNREVLKVIRSKHRAWKMYLATRQKSDLAYSKIRNHCTLIVRKARFLFEQLMLNLTPRSFGAINQTTKVKPGVSILQRDDGTITENDNDIAKLLNDYFCSVFTRENLENIPVLPPKNFDSPLTNIQITSDEVSQQLSRLQSHNSAGPDWCHPCVLYNV